MHTLFKTCFFSIFFLHTTIIFSQITLQGKVILDIEDYSSLDLVNIKVLSSKPVITKKVKSNGDFSFSIKKDKSSNTVRILISAPGYESQRKNGLIKSAGQIKLDFGRIRLKKITSASAKKSPTVTSLYFLDELSKNQYSYVDEALNYTLPSFNSTHQAISDATAHFDPYDFRNLGTSRVLMLVNGKRKNHSSHIYVNDTPNKGEVGVDMKSIPLMALKSVEVFPDDATAIYGSDAMAGVINLELEDQTDHTKVSSSYGYSREGDAQRFGFGINSGVKIKEGFINATMSFLNQKESNRAGAPGVDSLFGAPIENEWTKNNPSLGMRIGLPNSLMANFVFNSEFTLINNNQEKDNLEQDSMNSKLKIYGFGSLNYRNGKTYALYRTPYWPGINDSLFIMHDQGTDYQGFLPTFEIDIADRFSTFGLRGNKDKLDYDVSWTSGKNVGKYTVQESFNPSLANNTPTSFSVGGYGFSSNVFDVDLSYSDIFASSKTANIDILIGGEFRQEEFESIAGQEESYIGEGTISFPGISSGFIKNRYNFGGFSKIILKIPFTYDEKAKDYINSFNFGITGRYEEYSDFGNGEDPLYYKVGGNINIKTSPYSRLRIFGSYSTGFKAPTLHQYFISNIQSLVTVGNLPIDKEGTFNHESLALRQLGIPRLREEQSKSLFAGFEYSFYKTDVRNKKLVLRANFYKIDIDNRIVFSSKIGDSLNIEVLDILNQNNVKSIKFFYNAVNTSTLGIETFIKYESEIFHKDNRLNFYLGFDKNNTQLNSINIPETLEEVDLFDRTEQSRILKARPSEKIITKINFTRFFDSQSKSIGVNINNTWFGKVEWFHSNNEQLDQVYNGKLISDVGIEYNTIDQKVNFRMSLHINNLFDIYPDINTGIKETNLAGRFLYPWEVNQFGYLGRYTSIKLGLNF